MQRIVLEMPPSFSFQAGQYLQVLHPDGPIPLSIASAPWRLPELHLHYRSTAGVAEAARMDALLAAGEPLTVSAPGGEVILETPLAAPLLIAAGGTGIAQAISFIDAFATTDPGAPVTLLWCVDHPQDFYLDDQLAAVEAPWLTLVKIADADRSPGNACLAWLRQHIGEFSEDQTRGPSPVVLAGGPGFVYAAYEVLRAGGLSAVQIRSDVFAYAPRPE